MARLTTGQKAQRAIRFLVGLRRPRITSALMMYGFNQDTLDEGWTLLRDLAGQKLAVPEPLKQLDPALIDQLDAWENQWLLVTEVSLKRHYPEVADKVFLNLSRTSGPEVTVSVTTFLSRIKALKSGTEQEKAACDLLVKRGLTQPVLDRAQALLDAIGAVQELPQPAVDKDKIAAAEEAMWSWYREWSSIARIAIQDGRLLRSLGFGTRRRSTETAEEVFEEPNGDSTGHEEPATEMPVTQPA